MTNLKRDNLYLSLECFTEKNLSTVKDFVSILSKRLDKSRDHILLIIGGVIKELDKRQEIKSRDIKNPVIYKYRNDILRLKNEKKSLRYMEKYIYDAYKEKVSYKTIGNWLKALENGKS